MTPILNKRKANLSDYIGLLLVLHGAWTLFSRGPVGEFGSMSGAQIGAAIGSRLDGLIWILFGVIFLIVKLRSRKLPAAEYNETVFRKIQARLFGPPAMTAIPLTDIRRFQESEPGTIDIYYWNGKEETILNLIADPATTTEFQKFVNARSKTSV